MKGRIDISGVPFDPVTYSAALEHIETFMEGKAPHIVVTPNPEMILEAQDSPRFREVLNGASLSIPDGVGVLWASTYLKWPYRSFFLRRALQVVVSLSLILVRPSALKTVLPARVTGTDLMQRLMTRAEKKGWKVFLLGAGEGVAQAAAEQIKKKHPHVHIVGTYAGDGSPEFDDDTLEVVSEAKPDLLFVAYGAPKQELWLERNIARLQTVRVGIGVGGAFDFIAKKVRRAPRWMRSLGLEWLWRLFMEPSRFGRIWNATGRFIAFILRLKKQG